MRRLETLKNSLYHRKYKDIYKWLFNADLDEISDFSNWYKTNQDYIDKNRPLWIVVESKILNKRIWITEDFGKLEITTAQLDLDVKSNEYSDSHAYKRFKNQTEMSNYLHELLEPCLVEFENEEIKKDLANEIRDYMMDYFQDVKLNSELKDKLKEVCDSFAEITLVRYLENKQFDKNTEPQISFVDIDEYIDEFMEEHEIDNYVEETEL